MTALVGTVTIPGKGGLVGVQHTALLEYTLTGALVNADTITWSNVIPNGGATVVDVQLATPELDTNATPTMLFEVGNSDDRDGYILSHGGALTLSNSLADQMSAIGTGALIGTKVTNRDIVLTVTAAVATGATSGRILLKVLLQGTA